MLLLLDHGADVNQRVGLAKRAALHLATSKGDAEMVEYLLEFGAGEYSFSFFFFAFAFIFSVVVDARNPSTPFDSTSLSSTFVMQIRAFRTGRGRTPWQLPMRNWSAMCTRRLRRCCERQLTG